MNLLEIWLKEIIEEKEIDEDNVKVTASYVCWGATEIKTRIYPKYLWEKIKKKGYYLG